MKREIIFTWDNISSALYAVASSILTSALYDELSSTSYSIQNTQQGTVITPISELNLWEKMLITAALFLVIWIVLWILFSVIPHITQRIRYRNIAPYSQQQIVTQFRSAKQTIMKLQSLTVNPLLYADELAKTIRSLYKAFYQSRPGHAYTIKAAFRTGDMADDIEQYISPYDYQAVIDEAEKLVFKLKEMTSGGDELLRLDCTDLLKKIVCLKDTPGAKLCP